MKLPINQFKRKIQNGETQIGIWSGLANNISAEIAAVSGYDWILLDAEHAPNDISTLLAQLQAIAPYPSHPIIRPPIGDAPTIKQLLDLGAQTLLIPMVESAEQALNIVKSIHYPPKGIRGVGSALARASRWNSIDNYIHNADDEICLLLQIENQKGYNNLDAILATDNVDGIFIGPADLSASLGHRNNPTHPEVQEIIESIIKKTLAANKACGILFANLEYAQHYINLGCSFVAVGVDTTLLINSMKKLLSNFKETHSKDIKDSIY